MRLYLDPADNLMIRDGRPFNQNDAGQARAASRFPPPPDTVYGAVRVALARAMGWSGVGDWTQGAGGAARATALGAWGEAGETSASLRVAGPFFEVDGTPLLPIPGHVCARINSRTGTIQAMTALKPESEAMQTDQGPVRMLAMPAHAEGIKDDLLGGRWAPEVEVRRLLASGPRPSVSEQIDALAVRLPGPRRRDAATRLLNRGVALPGIGVDSLGATEARVGLERDFDSRQAVEGRLYASVRRVLPPGVRMFVDVCGLGVIDLDLTPPAPIGGEGRFGFLERGAATDRPPPTVPHADYLVVLTTPAILAPLKVGQAVERLSGTLVGAVVSGVTATASFERRDARVRALTASRAVIPAGSVLFLEGGRIGETLPEAMGDRTWRGYGRFAVGRM